MTRPYDPAQIKAIRARLADYSGATLHGAVPVATFGIVLDDVNYLLEQLDAAHARLNNHASERRT